MPIIRRTVMLGPSEVVVGLDGAGRLHTLAGAAAAEGAHEDDPLALLAGHTRPVVRVRRRGQVLVLLHLRCVPGEQVARAQAALAGGGEDLYRGLIRLVA